MFVSPHPSDDSVGQVAFVGSPGFSSSLSLGGLSSQIFLGVWTVALLGDGGDVEDTVDAPVASEVEAMFDRFAVAFARGESDGSGAAPASEFGFTGESEWIGDFAYQGCRADGCNAWFVTEGGAVFIEELVDESFQ